MRYLKFISPLILVFPLLTIANPPTMDIGTFSVDNYLGNASGNALASNLDYENQSADNFFIKGRGMISFYQGFNSNPAGNTSTATLHISKKDNLCTKAAITDLSSGSGHREYCDFLFFGGHGFPKGFFLGSNFTTYGKVYPIDLKLGKDYNRYMLINSCSIFNTASPLTDWSPAFAGLKALLGFKSLVTDNPANTYLYDAFWYYWTQGGGLSDSFAEAQNNYGTSYVSFPGIETGCISAKPITGTIDYCDETFRNVAYAHDRPASGAVYYHKKIIGSPIY